MADQVTEVAIRKALTVSTIVVLMSFIPVGPNSSIAIIQFGGHFFDSIGIAGMFTSVDWWNDFLVIFFATAIIDAITKTRKIYWDAAILTGFFSAFLLSGFGSSLVTSQIVGGGSILQYVGTYIIVAVATFLSIKLSRIVEGRSLTGGPV